MKKILWIGPMGRDDKNASNAIDLRNFAIKQACDNNAIELITPDESAIANNWLNTLIDLILKVDGVICDLSNQSCNVYFELGYALALRKSVLIIARKGSEIVADLANYQRHEYSNFDDITDVLNNWLVQIRKDHNEDVLPINYKLPHPIKIIEGDGSLDYKYESSPNKRPFQFLQQGEPPLTIEGIKKSNSTFSEIISRINAIQVDVANRLKKPFFNGELIGYMNHLPIRNEMGNQFGAKLYYRDTDYYTFAATHFYNDTLRAAENLKIVSKQEKEILLNEIQMLIKEDKWEYASPFTVTLYVILQTPVGDKIIIQNRNLDKNFHAQFPKQGTSAGMMHAKRVLNQDVDSSISPEIAFCHELLEETGLYIDRKAISILGFIEEQTNYECGFVGYVHIVNDALKSEKLPIDSFENNSFQLVDFTPFHLKEFIKNKANEGKDITPLSLGGLFLVVVRFFGLDSAIDIFGIEHG